MNSWCIKSLLKNIYKCLDYIYIYVHIYRCVCDDVFYGEVEWTERYMLPRHQSQSCSRLSQPNSHPKNCSEACMALKMKLRFLKMENPFSFNE